MGPPRSRAMRRVWPLGCAAASLLLLLLGLLADAASGGVAAGASPARGQAERPLHSFPGREGAGGADATEDETGAGEDAGMVPEAEESVQSKPEEGGRSRLGGPRSAWEVPVAVQVPMHPSKASRGAAPSWEPRQRMLRGRTRRPHPRSLLSPRGSGYWSTKGSKFVDAAGRVVYFSGVIWSGFETNAKVVHGLWGRSLESHLDQMKALGFNCIRLPFAGDTLLPTTFPKSTEINLLLNPKLKGLNSLQVMDWVIAECYYRGIKVILDYHRIHNTNDNELGLWWDLSTPPLVWANNWAMLAKRYKGNPTVIGADMFNEVHPCFWTAVCPKDGRAPYWAYKTSPSADKFNWRQWVYRGAMAIHRIEPRWIIFVEGIGSEYWWGGDVAKLFKAPLKLPTPNKLAYSAHEYGPYIYNMSFLSDPSFPHNMPSIYRKHWGFAQEGNIAPVWIGEFGSFYPQSTNNRTDAVERETFRSLINYIRRVQASWTIAFWDPTSKDTGSVLNLDWKTANTVKMSLLSGIMHPGFGPSKGQ